MEKEKWRPVPGYEGSYEVSDRGRVRSLDRADALGRPRKGRVLAAQQVNSGYLVVHLYDQGSRQIALVHRLVALAFCQPAPGCAEVDHRDHDRLNNSASNLRWVTHAANVVHSAHRRRPPRNGVVAAPTDSGVVGLYFPSQIAAETAIAGRPTGAVSWSIKKQRPAYGFIWSRA